MSTTTRSNDRGATLPIVALILPVLMIMTGFAVDLGRQRSDRRSMQAAADVISLDMARLIGDDTMREIRDRDAEIQSALTASAERNGLANATITAMSGPRVSLLEWGVLNASDRTFQPLTPIGASDPQWDIVPEAVRVTTRDTTDYLFQPGSGSVVRHAVARTAAGGGPACTLPCAPDEGGDAVAGFKIGSRLASVSTQQSVLLNAVLNGLFGSGSGLTLTVADYNALTGADVTLSQIAVELGAGSPEDLLGATMKVRDLYLAVADVLRVGGEVAAATVVERIALVVDADVAVAVASLVQVAAGAEDAAVAAGLDVFSLITGSAFVINGTNLISIPDVSVTVPGLLDLDLALKVVERPQWAFGPEGTRVTTSQVELTLTPQIRTGIDVGLVDARVEASLPLTVTVAGADTTLTDIECADDPGINVAVDSQMVNLQLGIDVNTYGRLLLGLVVVPLVNVDGTLNVATATGPGAVWFDHPVDFLPPEGSGTMVALPAPGLGLGGILSGSNLETLSVEVLNLDLGWVAADILGPVAAALNPILGQLESLVVTPLTEALGVELGGGDVGALGMICPPEQADLVG